VTEHQRCKGLGQEKFLTSAVTSESLLFGIDEVTPVKMCDVVVQVSLCYLASHSFDTRLC
jgi:hypothetical protein